MQPFVIAPSILSADFARLGEEVDNVLAAGADFVHFDVMDNHYVPNLTIGPMVCAALRKYGVTAPIDAHLMVSPVDRIVGDFIEAGATYITFHPEATQHVDRSLQLIREGGCKAGLVFNPATPLDVLKYVMDKVDMILLMSVNPGFGGQKFIPGTLDKLREARALIDASGRDIRLEIDGGVNVNNIREIAAAGADTFVAGSAIFNAPNYQEVIEKNALRTGAGSPMSGFEQLFPGRLPRLVMFDLDGTLVDSVPDLAAAVDNMLLKLGRQPAGIEPVREWVGNGVHMLVRRALANHIDAEGVDEVEAEHALELFNGFYEDGHDLTVVYPGVRDTLKWLNKQGIEMALITNKPERFVAPLLDQMKIGRYFKWIIGGDTLPNKKPDPAALFFFVMKMANIPASQSLFVGDSRSDVLAAKAAGGQMRGPQLRL